MEQRYFEEHATADGTEGNSGVVPPGEYMKAARAHLRNGQRKQAYGILLQAVALYPEHAVILSYCGWLQAIVDKKYKSGIAACRKAFVVFKASDPHTAGIVYPILYLNLGRAFLAAGKKKEAVENFNKGLRHDRGHVELKKEMRFLGTRKKPLVSFLSRSNPINKYVGILLDSTSPPVQSQSRRTIPH
jgi:tetratricopeptide (TPR) repeat protein